MALLITDQCINCDMCLPECPNEAIHECEKVYEIDVAIAQNVLGFMTIKPAFQSVQLNVLCPHPEHVETKEQLRKSLIS